MPRFSRLYVSFPFFLQVDGHFGEGRFDDSAYLVSDETDRDLDLAADGGQVVEDGIELLMEDVTHGAEPRQWNRRAGVWPSRRGERGMNVAKPGLAEGVLGGRLRTILHVDPSQKSGFTRAGFLAAMCEAHGYQAPQKSGSHTTTKN